MLDYTNTLFTIAFEFNARKKLLIDYWNYSIFFFQSLHTHVSNMCAGVGLKSERKLVPWHVWVVKG
jgi:hypothetical protein